MVKQIRSIVYQKYKGKTKEKDSEGDNETRYDVEQSDMDNDESFRSEFGRDGYAEVADGKTRKDSMQNDTIHEMADVVKASKKIQERRLHWY